MQTDREGTARARSADHRERAAVEFDEPARDGQPEPVPTAAEPLTR